MSKPARWFCKTCFRTGKAIYCAPKACYCGHPDCHAYDSYIPRRRKESPR